MINGKTTARITISAAVFGVGVILGAFITSERAIAQNTNDNEIYQYNECVIRNIPKLQNVTAENAFSWLITACRVHPRLGR